jgi:hypothetical protein
MARQRINSEQPKEQRTTKRRRILINMRGSITDQEAIDAVQQVISKGKTVIAAKNREHYSWITVMENGVVVLVTPKYWSRSETFTVSREEDIDVVHYEL